jgi:uncharacterized protein (DUF2336 family)
MAIAQSETSSAGRRRQALLQGVMAAGANLTMADVETLRSDRSEAARAMIARKLGLGLDSMVATGQEELFGAVLGLLARDVARCVREALAETVASSPHLPREIALVLAHDEITIARPVLEGSPVLQDQDLIQIVRTHATQYALAVAARTSLSNTVSEALVDTGEGEVVGAVVANPGADLSPELLRRVAKQWAGDPAVQERLVRRPGLPFNLVEQMVEAIGQRLEIDLVRGRGLTAEEARELMRVTRERAAIAIAARDRDERGMERAMRARHAHGELGPESLIAMLRDGDVASFELAVAVLADVEPRRCRQLIYHDDRRHLAALCVRAGVPTPHYLSVRIALQLAQAAVAGSDREAPYGNDTIRFLHEQYERLRTDPESVRKLLGTPGAP